MFGGDYRARSPAGEAVVGSDCPRQSFNTDPSSPFGKHPITQKNGSPIGEPFFRGGDYRARTCDPLLVRQMLSQLSYAPTYYLSLGNAGAGYEARTRYLHLGKVALYQMS